MLYLYKQNVKQVKNTSKLTLVSIFLTVGIIAKETTKFQEGISSTGTIFKVTVNSMRC